MWLRFAMRAACLTVGQESISAIRQIDAAMTTIQKWFVLSGGVHACVSACARFCECVCVCVCVAFVLRLRVLCVLCVLLVLRVLRVCAFALCAFHACVRFLAFMRPAVPTGRCKSKRLAAP